MAGKMVAIKRSEAAELIEHVRAMILNAKEKDGAISAQIVEDAFKDYGIPPLTSCPGEAHSNPYIDDCGVCAPLWGRIGPRVVVK